RWTPGPTRDQVGAERDPAVAADLGMREARRVAVRVLEPDVVAERRGALPGDELEPSALLEQPRQRSDERRAVARMGLTRALPRAPAAAEARVRKQQTRRAAVPEPARQ